MDIWSTFWHQLLETTWLEAIAVICGILSVWYSKQEKILVYPIGIVSVLIYVYITYKYKLYADTGINVYYFLMSVFGWWNWKNTKDAGSSQIPISNTSGGGHVVNIGTFVLSAILIWYILENFTDSDVPVFDAITTGLAITAMYLMALKKIEHWYFWIACNLISIPLYIYKGLPFTSLQFLVFTVLAVMGLTSWKRKLLMEQS